MADLRSQRNIASRLLKAGKNRIWIDPAKAADIEESITARDINRLIADGVIALKPKKGISSWRKHRKFLQKKKGRGKGRGSRKGSVGTRVGRKVSWVKKIRSIRKTLREMRNSGSIERSVYREMYRKASGGFFRNRAHVVSYIEKEGMLKKEFKRKIVSLKKEETAVPEKKLIKKEKQPAISDNKDKEVKK